MARVNELLLQEISRYVLRRQDPEVGFITFTGVETTDDLLEAKVFYSVLGSAAEIEQTTAALERLKSEIHRSMRRLESLKYIPKLHFVYDDTPSRAARVLELVEEIHRGDQGAGARTSEAGAPPRPPTGRPKGPPPRAPRGKKKE